MIKNQPFMKEEVKLIDAFTKTIFGTAKEFNDDIEEALVILWDHSAPLESIAGPEISRDKTRVELVGGWTYKQWEAGMQLGLLTAVIPASDQSDDLLTDPA